MNKEKINTVIDELFRDSKGDFFKMIKTVSKSVVRPLTPVDFKDLYLSISKEQGEDLTKLVVEKNYKNIVEFGTSFGISTLYLALGAMETNGHIITTELITSKANKAKETFKKAGVDNLIDLRIGDAMKTLQHHKDPIDLLFLDGWKDVYLPLFQMLETNFHPNTTIYVDNANMKETQQFLDVISQQPTYRLQPLYNGKVFLISIL
ncbi:O-methyltransferase [Aquimarina amphilecti]|uniref:O-methyltransferase n=1 Tax=Aquimarina amphilecti TaxID=1038014 RepID=A0A1H7UQ93_AQUAM|nr:class I SAM-dependent methyltransferase [Aquimarina amphilecti]SEL99133.1 O-methyltransferase [Aquimarina amphilecti]